MIAIFDTETDSPDPTDARIIQAHVGLLNKQGAAVGRQTILIKPDRPIPAEAEAIHGISTEHAEQHGIPRHVAIPQLLDLIDEMTTLGGGIAAFNAVYDFTVLDREARRVGIINPPEPGPIIDPMVIDKALDTYRRGKRTLSAVCHHYGVPFDEQAAHGAEYDALACGQLALIMLRDPRIAEPIQYAPSIMDARTMVHSWQIVWRRRQQASFRDYRLQRGEDVSDIRPDWPVIPNTPEV